MKISIIGGGNIGTWLAGEWGMGGHEVCMYTHHPEQWSRSIAVLDRNAGILGEGPLALVTSDLKAAIDFGDLILVTWPAHVRPSLLAELGKLARPEQVVAVMPGTGGVEFLAEGILRRGAFFCGFQRVASIARIKEYGRSVHMLGKKSEVVLGVVGDSPGEEISRRFSDLLGIPCKMVKNYLEVTLTPSNPVLHTARVYQLFKNYHPGVVYNKCPLFYEEWEDEASECLLGADAELQTFCSLMSAQGLDMRGVISLKSYYESSVPDALSHKLRSISAFKGIRAPMTGVPGGFVPDLSSRYFLEDFSYGICIVKGFCEIGGISTPVIDRELQWFSRLMGLEYYREGAYIGRDLVATGSPQRFGFRTVQDVLDFYLR